MEYYDKILIAIPMAIAAGVFASAHPAVALAQGIAGGSVVGILLVFDLLFRNPPDVPTPVPVAAMIVLGSTLSLSIWWYL